MVNLDSNESQLKKRGLKATGTKTQLVAALLESDRELSKMTLEMNKSESNVLDETSLNSVNILQSDSEGDSKFPSATTTEAMPDFESMTVAELKEELKLRGLKVGGKKSELINRLLQA